MKKVFIVFACTLASFSYSQDKKDFSKYEIFAVEVIQGTKGSSFVDSKCQKTGEGPINGNYYKENIFMLEDYMLCNDGSGPQFFYKVFNGDFSSYIPVSSAKVISKGKTDDQAKMFFSQLPKEHKEELSQYFRKQKQNSEEIAKAEEDFEKAKEDHDIISEGLEVMKNPVVILDYGFGGEYSVGFHVEIYNPSRSRIKYVYFTLQGFNDVDDVVRTYGGESTARRTGVGPIEPDESGSWNFETIWPDNQFSKGRITSLTVEYFNGTKKTFTKVGNLVMPEDYLPALERLKKWNAEHPVSE